MLSIRHLMFALAMAAGVIVFAGCSHHDHHREDRHVRWHDDDHWRHRDHHHYGGRDYDRRDWHDASYRHRRHHRWD